MNRQHLFSDLRCPVTAIQKVDISLHGVAAIFYKILQGDSGSAKKPLNETHCCKASLRLGTINSKPMKSYISTHFKTIHETYAWKLILLYVKTVL